MFLGLDLSLRATGIALLCPEELSGWNITTLSPPDKFRDTDRLSYLREGIREYLSGNNITLVAIEGYSYGSRNNQFYLGELGGVIRLLLHDARIPRIIVAPNILKKWATGVGNADKIAMAICTYERFGLKFEDDNQCDAFNLATIAAAYSGEPMHRMVADHRKMLDVIRANPLGLPKGRGK